MMTTENISRRDYFAGQALAALLSDPELTMAPDQIAEHVFDVADAMVAELVKREAVQ
ncbi:hypothetical protein GCM10011349_11880 [Novosphingobium indicum]|uniref:Uncharacterized protein n=1 Tax=Novosphingobium indicum TaxID=462949 RepID=A0ABQ2JF47_9SPHN|nr:hypothetical protein [Novosphingobium indicum]GGN45600.1 hypothetical protein GCM10011349_11880 [Novosphingobium indicum]